MAVQKGPLDLAPRTAQWYYNKYHEQYFEKAELSIDYRFVTLALFQEFDAEYVSGTTDAVCMDDLVVVAERLNKKWNDLGALFQKGYGRSPLIRDGFGNALRAKYAEAFIEGGDL